eukprot:5185631-Ditylum_brightwellii.AAC.1
MKFIGQKNSRNINNYKEFLRKEFKLEDFLRKEKNQCKINGANVICMQNINTAKKRKDATINKHI